jgi:lipopolysaccharide transport system permease protein
MELRRSRIEPPRWFSFPSPSEIWQWRELLAYLAWRDIKVRYKQAVLGVAWAVLNPLALMLVFTLFFGIIFGTPSAGVPRPVFIFAGVVTWVLFSEMLSSASNSLLKDRSLLEKLYFPRLVLPISATISPLVDYLFGLLALAIMMLAYGQRLRFSMLFLPFYVALVWLLALALGIWLSGLNLQFTDFRHITPLMIQIWFYTTPIFYPVDAIPESWRPLYRANPMVGIIEGIRWCLFGTAPPDPGELMLSLVPFLVLFVAGAMYFSRYESVFAENL